MKKQDNGSRKRPPSSLQDETSFLTLLETGTRNRWKKPRPARSYGLEAEADVTAPAPSAATPAQPTPAPAIALVLPAAVLQSWDNDPDAPPATAPAAAAPAQTPPQAIETLVAPPAVTAPPAAPAEAAPPPVVQAGTFRMIDGGTLPDEYEIDRDIEAINDPRLERREQSAREQAIDAFLRQLSASAPPTAAPAYAPSADVLDAIADTEELTRPAQLTKKKTPPAMMPTQDPTLETLPPDAATTTRAVRNKGCGGYVWLVRFELPAVAANDGWLIQEIDGLYDIKDASGAVVNSEKYHYWEAWEIKKGKKITVYNEGGFPYDDMYSDPSFLANKGKMGAKGKVRFYEGTLPADFKKNNASTYAGILHATTKKPPFWDGSGVDHDLMSDFDCTATPNVENIDAVAAGVKIAVIK